MDESAEAAHQTRATYPAESPSPHRAQTSSPPIPPQLQRLPENIAPAAAPSWIAARPSPHREIPASETHPTWAHTATPHPLESPRRAEHPWAHKTLEAA